MKLRTAVRSAPKPQLSGRPEGSFATARSRFRVRAARGAGKARRALALLEKARGGKAR